MLINLRKRGSVSTSNVTIRGTSESSLALRPQVRMTAGRMPRPGLSEIMVGEGIAQRFQNAGHNETLSFANRDWTVVGVFDAGNTGFNSEIWGDAEQLMQAFRRQAYSSVIFRLRDPAAFAAVKARIEGDPRLSLEAKREVTYYQDQSEATATFLRILGTSLTIIFSIGAVVGAMITMYAAVANRTAEIGTLRAVGFQRSAILIRLPGGGPAARLAGRARRTLPRLLPAILHGVHHQLPDLRRTGLSVQAESENRDRRACLRADHGADRGAAAGLPGGAHEHRGGLAGSVRPMTLFNPGNGVGSGPTCFLRGYLFSEMASDKTSLFRHPDFLPILQSC